MRVNYVCETCGRTGSRLYARCQVPSHFFCSRECQNKWQKTREDIVQKNKSPEFRKKVSAGLRKRKEVLGDNYHSPATKRKIGKATMKHWEEYDEATRNHILSILKQNAQERRTYDAHDYEWSLISSRMRENGICHRCGSRESLNVHHIIPAYAGGGKERKNLVVLCETCHTTVEFWEKEIYGIIPDWDVARLLVRGRLHCL